MLRMLPSYHQHMLQHPKSTLSKFYGLHSVLVPHQEEQTQDEEAVDRGLHTNRGEQKRNRARRRKLASARVYFSVIGNVFDPNKRIYQRFDCKGSSAGRKAKPKERSRGDCMCVYKDADWTDMRRRMWMSEQQRKQFSTQMAADVGFLRRQV